MILNEESRMGSDFPHALFSRLPTLEPVQEKIDLCRHDTLIHASGFEDRTLAVFKELGVVADARAILFKYLPANRNNRIDDVLTELMKKGIHPDNDDLLIYDRFHPEGFEKALKARLVAQDAKRVLVDISSMSRLQIILVLNVCRALNLDVKVFYAEADFYGPTKEDFKKARDKGEIQRPSLHVFSGVHGMVRVDSLSSVAMQGQPTAAIVFMSFNNALTQLLLNTVYPTRLLLINGVPPSKHGWREAATAWVHEEVLREWPEDNPLRERVAGLWLPGRIASTLDYRESVALLLAMYWRLSAAHRILLAPSGSKMQAVACFLVKALHPDIHVEYPSPEGFAREYSKGVGDCWIIDFGPLRNWLDEFGNVERHEYLELAL